MTTDRPIGVVGLGAMGSVMATSVVARRAVMGFDVDPAAVTRAQAAGVAPAGSLAELVDHCDIIVSSLPRPEHLRTLLADLHGLARAVTLIDTSTIDPATARLSAEMLAEIDGRFVESPILGRPAGVGAWTALVGGDENAVDLTRSALEPAAVRFVWAGPVGAASAMKLVNNLMFGIINSATTEALALARRVGIDPQRFVQIISESNAATVSGLFKESGARAAVGNFDPVFAVELLEKDLRLALDMAPDLRLDVGSAALAQCVEALERGLGGQDASVILEVLNTTERSPAGQEA